MDMAERIRSKLQTAFNPDHLTVIDESARHAGHAGARPGGQTHFRVVIVSQTFAGKPRVDRHRTINDLLEAEFSDGLHALTVRALAPDEKQQSL